MSAQQVDMNKLAFIGWIERLQKNASLHYTAQLLLLCSSAIKITDKVTELSCKRILQANW